MSLNIDRDARRLSTYATATQNDQSSTRCHSAYAASQRVTSAHTNNNNAMDRTLYNTRRETKMRRRTSVPTTEEEQDVVKYLTSRPPTRSSSSSKYNFENEPTMLDNLSLEDLQETFKS